MAINNEKIARKKILIIVNHGVNGGLELKEALDFAMLATALSQQVSLLFLGDGVYHWCRDQQPQQVGLKPFFKMLGALPLYDITQVYVCQRSVQERVGRFEAVVSDVTYVDNVSIKHLMEKSDVIVDY